MGLFDRKVVGTSIESLSFEDEDPIFFVRGLEGARALGGEAIAGAGVEPGGLSFARHFRGREFNGGTDRGVDEGGAVIDRFGGGDEFGWDGGLLGDEFRGGAEAPESNRIVEAGQMAHLFSAGEAEGLSPRFGDASAWVVSRIFGAIIPTPDAMAAISDARGRSHEETPITGAANLVGRDALFGLVGDVILVGWLEIDEGTVGTFGPIGGGWAGSEPLESAIVVAVAALVTVEFEPAFALKFVEHPVHAAGVHSGESAGIAKNGAADALPFLGFFAAIIAIAAEEIGDVVGAPTGDHVLGEEDGLVFGEIDTGIDFGIAAGGDGPEQDGNAQESGFVQGIVLAIEVLEELGVDLDFFAAGEGESFGAISLGGSAPLSGDPLDSGEALTEANINVMTPFLGTGKESTVPGSVRQPEIGGAIFVVEEAAIAGDLERAVFRKAIAVLWSGAGEGTGDFGEAFIGGVGTDGGVNPFADFVWRKADFPAFAAVPEGVDDFALAGGGGEDDGEGDVLEGIAVIAGAFEIALEPLPFRNQNQSCFRGEGREKQRYQCKASQLEHNRSV